MVFSKMRIWLHEPIEREQIVLNMATMTIIVRVAFFLDRCMWLIKMQLQLRKEKRWK